MKIGNSASVPYEFLESKTYHVASASTWPNVHSLSLLLSPARDRMSSVSLTNQPMKNHIVHRPTTITAQRIIPESGVNIPGRCRTMETTKSTRYVVTPRHRIPATVQAKIAMPLNDPTFRQGLSSNAGSLCFQPAPSAPLKSFELRAARTTTIMFMINNANTRPLYL